MKLFTSFRHLSVLATLGVVLGLVGSPGIFAANFKPALPSPQLQQIGSQETGTTPAAPNTIEPAGTYQVFLPLVVNMTEGTNSVIYATDHFERSVSSSWGSADSGQAYATAGSASFAVADGAGTMTLAPGTSGAALLPAVTAQDVDIRVRVQTDEPVDDTRSAYIAARSVSGGDEYRGRLRLLPSGDLAVQAIRFTNNTEIALGNEVTVAEVGHRPGAALWLRMQVADVAPASIALKIWVDGDREPADWQYSVLDDTDSLQHSGAVGFGAGAATGSVFSFDDLHAEAVIPAIVTPDEIPSSEEPEAETDTTEPEPTGVEPTSSSVTIKDTNYAIPSGAYFVSTSGSDSNSGTQTSPFRTVQKAVDTAPSGRTIVLRGGTYREYVTFYGKALTLQPYPHEQVWFNGSNIVTGWVADGKIWRKDNWTYKFKQGGVDSTFTDPAYPYSSFPDMVFRNGTALRQVGSKAAVIPGTFYVDYTYNRLYVGDNPSGVTVEATARSQALYLNQTTGSVVRGLGFKYYATHPYQFGTVKGNGSRLTFENNTFAWNASIGLSILKTDAVVRGNSFLYNGQLGMHGNYAHRLLVEQNRFAYNNQEHFKLISAAGGIKVTSGRDMIWRDNLSEGNLGGGMWCDLSCYNVTIVRNTVRNNAQNGILYEISAKAIIASNLIHGNGRYALSLNESEDLDIYNNTLSKNRCNISVWEGYRYSSTDPAIKWNVRDVVIRNNVLSNATSTDGLLKVRSQDEHKNASQMGVSANYDAYYRTNAAAPATLVEWVSYNRLVLHKTMPAFRSATGHEANGLYVDNVAVNPFFVDEAAGNYNLKVGSLAIGSGTPLPTAVANAIGVQAGVPVNRGFLKLYW